MKPQNDQHSDHKHSHVHSEKGPRPHPLAHFFGCCLGDDPAPLSPKIQSLRENLEIDQLDSITIIPGEHFTITKDMIVGDILTNFPASRPLLQDLHPLGLMSPALNAISLEIFLSDLPINQDLVCQQLSTIINQPSTHNA